MMNCPDQFLAVCRFLEPLLGWLVVFSMVTFVLSLVLIPWVVGRLSPDCFLRLHLNDSITPPPSFGLVVLVILRHALGTVLLMAGIAMLFLPGQGLLTIILGALLVSFPGKRKLIGSLVSQPKIRKSLDWLRNKRHKPPFFWPEFPGDSDER
jgi:hypothetical protein